MVQVDIGQHRANNLPLAGPRLAYQESAFVHHANIYPLTYQPENAGIANPPLNHLHELRSHDRIEIGANVELKNVLGRLTAYPLANFVQRIVCAASRPEAV